MCVLTILSQLTAIMSLRLQCVFPFNNWIDKEHGLSVLLTPDRDGDGVGDALEGGPIVEFTATVYTSDMR